MNLLQIKGDLFKTDAPVIVQQLNCLSVKGHGLSAAISKKFPYADVYARRQAIGKKNLAIDEDRGVPGQIVVSKPTNSSQPGGDNNPIVVGLYGQYDYGKPGKSWRSNKSQDNYELREQWFQESLDKLRNWMIQEGHSKVAFPHGIGCGLAGGDWSKYLQMLNKFAAGAPYQVLIYRL